MHILGLRIFVEVQNFEHRIFLGLRICRSLPSERIAQNGVHILLTLFFLDTDDFRWRKVQKNQAKGSWGVIMQP